MICVVLHCIEIHDLWRVLVVCVWVNEWLVSVSHECEISKLKSVRVHGQKVNRIVFKRRTWKRRSQQSNKATNTQYEYMCTCFMRHGTLWRESTWVALFCAWKRSEFIFCIVIVMMRTLRFVVHDTDIDWLRNYFAWYDMTTIICFSVHLNWLSECSIM